MRFGVLVGSTTDFVSSYTLARLLDFDESLRLSLLPRPRNTPFAMTVSGDTGGAPALTAMLVVIKITDDYFIHRTFGGNT